MAVYFTLAEGGSAVADYSDYEIAAFVNDECRGIAEIQSAAPAGESPVEYGYLRIRSNQAEGEEVSFRVYQKSSERTLWVNETMTFSAQDLKGMPSSPVVLKLSDVLKGDVNGDGRVNSVDLSLLIDKILQIENPNFIDAAGDINNDGEFSSVDYSMMINLIIN